MSVAAARIGMGCYHVESKGFRGGLTLFWRLGIDVRIICSSDWFIHCAVMDEGSVPCWYATEVYGSTRQYKYHPWNQSAVLNSKEYE